MYVIINSSSEKLRIMNFFSRRAIFVFFFFKRISCNDHKNGCCRFRCSASTFVQVHRTDDATWSLGIAQVHRDGQPYAALLLDAGRVSSSAERQVGQVVFLARHFLSEERANENVHGTIRKFDPPTRRFTFFLPSNGSS